MSIYNVMYSDVQLFRQMLFDVKFFSFLGRPISIYIVLYIYFLKEPTNRWNYLKKIYGSRLENVDCETLCKNQSQFGYGTTG